MRIKELRELKGIQQKELALELNIPPNTLSQYENGKREPNFDVLKTIAEYFNVTTDYLLGHVEQTFCSSCGLFYNPLNNEEYTKHQDYHSAWERAVKKYGFCWNRIKSDELESLSRKRLEETDISNEMARSYAMDILSAKFSDELREHNFQYSHDFNYFVANQLAKHSFTEILPKQVYDELVAQYGIAELNPSDNSIQLSDKDNRDIKKDLDSIMEKLSNQEYGPAAYDGEDLSVESVELFRDELEIALKRLKLINKEKYNPNKNKK